MNIVPTVFEKNMQGMYDLTSRCFQDRVIFVNGIVNEDLASLVMKQLLYLDAENSAPIEMNIRSSGGYVMSALAIYDTMQYCTAPIKTIACGLLGSLATLLLACGKIGSRFITKNAKCMLHIPEHSYTDIFLNERISDQNIDICRATIVREFSKCTKQTETHIYEMCDSDQYLSAEEVIQYGFADSILEKNVNAAEDEMLKRPRMQKILR